jgi:hypothetical protein
MDHLQAMIDGMAAHGQRVRSTEQITLGCLIDALKCLPKDKEIDGIGEPHSYRGYYCDLAFEKVNAKTTAGDLLNICKSAMGEVFEGYKGGDYMMGRNTPLWLAYCGCCGSKIMDLRDDGSFETLDDD